MQTHIEGLEDYFIPLPAGTVVKGREVIGIMPCHRKLCGEWGYVTKANTHDDHYPTCGSNINARGCKKLQPHYNRSDLPNQKIEIAQERLSYLDPQSDYSFLIHNAWNLERSPDGNTAEETDDTTTGDTAAVEEADEIGQDIEESQADDLDAGAGDLDTGSDEAGNLEGSGQPTVSTGSYTGDPELDAACGFN